SALATSPPSTCAADDAITHGSSCAAYGRAACSAVTSPAMPWGHAAATTVTTASGTASAIVQIPASDASRPSVAARTSRGSATTRTTLASSTTARYSWYAAKNPSVFTPCPNFRERMTPATAAVPLTAAVEIPVRIPLETVPRLDRLLSIDARRRYSDLDDPRDRGSPGRVRRPLPRADVPRHGRR